MAHLIEFYTPSSFRPTIKWPPKEERGKVIAFMSPRKESAAIVCGAYEELDSESSQWSHPGLTKAPLFQTPAESSFKRPDRGWQLTTSHQGTGNIGLQPTCQNLACAHYEQASAGS
jgi:hypothetical protein